MYSEIKMKENKNDERRIKSLKDKLKEKDEMIQQLEKDNYELKKIIFSINQEADQIEY
jgi:hypothetical protein